ncbi:unnamed protein product [Rotaria sp. Silwood2]|nr:unnamed protein product [Rotaria sp. Silwood2]CAF2889408.1 unnamed protein product [Rotaria sp. Silwood2]CAF3273987.1 unnamed protein product [Rotaria sp. Silwood2]CAF4070721.1 unnamed protein product [Rotaria sp. Silwood2]CAF4241104.1 unnamed protein product [Rotaria sp. Silwood2]
MVLTSDEISSSRNDEIHSLSSTNKLPVENEEVERIETPLSTTTDEKEKSFATSTTLESELKLTSIENSNSISSDEINKENLDNNRRNLLKSRSVSFAPMVEEIEIPSSRHSSFSSTHPPVDFVDVLVESYRLETSNNLFPLNEEKTYIPKTTRTRLNPNWREHRMRRLMNKLEELSLWDREQELKATQAQILREQKLEQIQDRQRNHDLCLQLMRQRHDSEMESAILLDRAANNVNDENTSATIAQAMNLASPANVLAYDLPTPPQTIKRRVRQEQDKLLNLKTPIGRYRQFETTMNNKVDKINQKLKPDWPIMRAYSPYYTPIPSSFVPLFSETYIGLLSLPDIHSFNRHNQYHYGVTSYLNQSPPHASSPDHETRLRSHAKRDVRVPLKEQINDSMRYNDDDDDNDEYNHARFNSSQPKRSTNIVSSSASSLYDGSTLTYTPGESSLIHSRQPLSNSIHQRSLNDDLNAITNFSLETSKQILRSISGSSNGALTKNRSSSVPTNKRVKFIDQDDDHEENFNSNKSSRMMYQPEMISLSATR